MWLPVQQLAGGSEHHQQRPAKSACNRCRLTAAARHGGSAQRPHTACQGLEQRHGPSSAPAPQQRSSAWQWGQCTRLRDRQQPLLHSPSSSGSDQVTAADWLTGKPIARAFKATEAELAFASGAVVDGLGESSVRRRMWRGSDTSCRTGCTSRCCIRRHRQWSPGPVTAHIRHCCSCTVPATQRGAGRSARMSS